jgi:hypothetical protein
VSMPTYLIVVGWPMLGFSSLMRHGEAELVGRRINRGNVGNVGHGWKENNKGSECSERKSRGRMKK